MFDSVKQCNFSGPLAKQFHEFVSLKRAMGLKFATEVYVLSVFDKYLHKLGSLPNCLSKESVVEFASKRDGESHKSFSNRASLIRQLGLFMFKMGYDAYVLPPFKIHKSSFIPHIYSQNELQKIFNAIDTMKVDNKFAKLRAAIYPVLIRVLYGCGLRIGETVRLTVEDVNLTDGYLVVKNAKNNSERIVPMSNSLKAICRKYHNEMHLAGDHTYFFPAQDGGFLCAGIIGKWIKSFYEKNGIVKTARIHDFRHTFAVHVLNRAAKNNVDINSVLPALSKYMGHTHMQGTEKYLRLTADVFPELTETFEKYFGGVMPEAVGYE